LIGNTYVFPGKARLPLDRRNDPIAGGKPDKQENVRRTRDLSPAGALYSSSAVPADLESEDPTVDDTSGYLECPSQGAQAWSEIAVLSGVDEPKSGSGSG